MRIKKVFEVAIRVPVTEFGNIDEFALRTLKNTYEKTNFLKFFIEEIEEITQRSPCVISSSDLSADGVISIQFRCSVLTYLYGEIMADCKVVSIQDNIINLTRENTSIILMLTGKQIPWLKVGQSIPLVCDMAQHLNGMEGISVNSGLLQDWKHPITQCKYIIANWGDMREIAWYVSEIGRLTGMIDKKSQKMRNKIVKGQLFSSGLTPKKSTKIDLTKPLPDIKEPIVICYPSINDPFIYSEPQDEKTTDLIKKESNILIDIYRYHISFLSSMIELGKMPETMVNKILKASKGLH
jgi:hypothetical protein